MKYKHITLMNREWSLKTLLSISFMVISIIVIGSSAVLIYNKVFDILQKRSEQMTIQQFEQAQYNIQMFSEEVDKVSKSILLDSSVQGWLEQEHLQRDDQIIVASNVIGTLSAVLANYSYLDSIYITTESGEMIRVNATMSNAKLDPDKQGPFFQSVLNRQARLHFPLMTWVGASSDMGDDFYSEYTKHTAIAAVRGIKANYQARQSGTLVLFIKEEHLNSIYGHLSNSDAGYMYILDGNGRIISHSSKSMIGKINTVYPSIDRRLTHSSFINKNKEQVIYYWIQDKDWMLIRETPLKEYAKDIITLRQLMIIVFVTSLVLTFIISTFWIEIVTRSLKDLTLAMKKIGQGNFGVIIHKMPRNELAMLVRQFNQMSINIYDLIKQNKEIELEKRRYEVAALQRQINPHFLYNTLNTVKWMALTVNATNIADLITILGNMLLPIFKSQNMLCRMDEEINYVKNYVRIMNYRYGDGIKVHFEIEERILSCEILRFILQPLVENAFYHGYKKQNGRGTIYVKGKENSGVVMLSVSDNGVGIPPDQMTEILKELHAGKLVSNDVLEGIGLQNVNQRIRLHFGEDYGIFIESTMNKGTTVTVKTPYN